MTDNGKKQSKFDIVVGAVDKLSAPFKAINNTIARNTEGLKRLKNSVSSLNREAGFTTLSKSAGTALTSIRNVGKEGRNLVGTISGAVGKLSLVLGGTSGGFFALARSTAAAGEAAAKAAQRAKVGTRTWQEYAYAAKISSISADSMEKSLSGIQTAAIKAFQGDKSAKSALKDLGIAFKTANGEVRNADNLFTDLAKRVQELNAAGQEAKATQLVTNLLGGDGAAILPLLNEGAEGLRKMRLEAHEMGNVLGGKDTDAAKAFGKESNRMKAALQGIGFTIGRELLPHFTEIAQKVTAWSSANRELIGAKVSEFMQRIRENLPTIITGFTSVVEGVQTFIGVAQTIARVVGGWQNVFAVLGGIMAGKFIFSIFTAVKALGALKFAMLATPLGILTTLATAASLIYANWDGIREWFSDLFSGITEAIRKFTDKIPDWLKAKLGISILTGGASGLAASAGAAIGANLGAESIAREVSESKTSTVERKENTVYLRAAPGTELLPEGGGLPVERLEYGPDQLGSQVWGD